MNRDVDFIAAVNNNCILQNNLLRSEIFTSNIFDLFSYTNQYSASIAYNKGISETGRKYSVFAHQDVYFPKSWISKLENSINSLEITDPDWAVLGSIGITSTGDHVGRVWSSGLGKEVGTDISQPVRVESLDELVLVVRRSADLEFDEDLPGFHLYGTDIVQIAKSLGFSAYAADLPVVHNSQPIRSLGGSYAKAHAYMRQKWRETLPLQTLVVPLTSSSIPLLRARNHTFWTRNRRTKRAVSNKSNPREIAEELGYE